MLPLPTLLFDEDLSTRKSSAFQQRGYFKMKSMLYFLKRVFELLINAVIILNNKKEVQQLYGFEFIFI